VLGTVVSLSKAVDIVVTMRKGWQLIKQVYNTKHSLSVVLLMANLEFKFGNTSLQVKQMLLQVRLLGLQGGDLLL
jgi:hypothetical protein